MLTKSARARKIDINENSDSLFALLGKITKSNPHVLPFETKEKFLDFFTKKHKSEAWAWNDSQGNLVGFFSLIDMPKEGTMELLAIGVDPEFQNKGYGKQMIAFAEKLALKNGRRKMMLVTNKKNLPAISFYKRRGYVSIKEIYDYYGDGETRCLFEKTLVEDSP